MKNWDARAGTTWACSELTCRIADVGWGKSMGTDYRKLSLEALDRAAATTSGPDRMFMLDEAMRMHQLARRAEAASLARDAAKTSKPPAGS